MFRRLLCLTATAEGLTGVTLLFAPHMVIDLLFGADLSAVALVLGQVCGIALLALAIACWPKWPEALDRQGLAMLVYNGLVGGVLIYAGAVAGFAGPLLWPAAIFHAAMAALLVTSTKAALSATHSG